MARHIQLLDTTLRDGEQTRGVSFAQDEKVSIAKALLKSLRVDRVEVASAGVSAGEHQAVSRIIAWAAEHSLADRVEVLGFVDRSRSVDWIANAGGQVLNLLTKGSERHCLEQLRRSPAQHITDIREAVACACNRGLAVNVYLEDWSNGYRDSRDYVYRLVDGIRDIGIGHFMLPDTLGVMMPDEVFTNLADMTRRFPDLQFDFHPHNDYGLATANAMMAVRAGVSTIHCTVNCLGERAGNVSLAEVAVVLRDQMGLKLSVDESRICALSRMVETFSGKRVADNAPVIGADVFTQTCGVHADGDHKGKLYQTELGPERFGRKRIYALGKMSGKASLQKNLDDIGISVADEDLAKLLERVVQLGDSKATVTPDDLPFILADILEDKNFSHIELLNCAISSGLDLESTVSIRVRVDGMIHKASGVGNGGFDAFIAAMRSVLDKRHFEFPQLLDYEIRIPQGGSTGALTECFVTWADGERSFRTRGVDTNQVLAGIKAAVRMLNIKLHQANTAQVAAEFDRRAAAE